MKDIHNYILEKQLCENQFVCVFHAVDRESRKSFMLSIVNDEYEINPKFLMRMISDRSKFQVVHPHVAKIVDYGEIESKQYFVTEYFGSKTLSSFLGKPVSAAFALDVVSQLASGLHYLSIQGHVHGNIHPDNIFFDTYGNAILSAMELTLKPSSKEAGEKNEDDTRADNNVESKGRVKNLSVSRYQSPETVAGNMSDQCSDLYSLGVILFELLTGEYFSDRKYVMTTGV
ncbi:MAG: protein kinase, partial [Gammaproteobacteria bacterium]|nr:protein kinase [Gammaproteobacteria bacterium]